MDVHKSQQCGRAMHLRLALSPKAEFLLHTFYRLSCSARLRIALNPKEVPAKCAYVHLFKDQQMSPEHDQLSRSCSFPLLTRLIDDGPPFPIRQYAAAIESLEEVFPSRCPLLPPLAHPLEHAKVGVLANAITDDIQPIANRRIAKAVNSLGDDVAAWNKDFTTQGLEACGRTTAQTAGRYSVGDAASMANVCPVPAERKVEKSDVNLERLPTTKWIYCALSELKGSTEGALERTG